MKKYQKIIAMATALLIVASGPMTAYAAVHDNVNSAEKVTDIFANDTDEQVVINLSGDIDMDGESLTAGDGQTYTFNGTDEYGNNIYTIDELLLFGSGDVTVNADLTGEDGDALSVYESVTVTVNGDITATSDSNAIDADDDTQIYVTGDVSSKTSDAINADDSTYIEVVGNVTSEGSDAIDADAGDEDESVTVIVKGNVTAGADGADIEAKYGGKVTVTVTGNITANDNGVEIESNYDGDADVTVTGDIDAKADGVYAYTEDGEVDVTVTGDIDAGADGVYAYTEDGEADVTVTGDIEAAHSGVAAGVTDGSMNVTVNGNITADTDSYGDGVYIWANGGEATLNVTGNVSTNSMDDYYDGLYIDYAGLYIDVENGAVVNATVKGDITSEYTDGVYVDVGGGEADVTVTGDIDAGADGINAYAAADSSAAIAVTGNITGSDGYGICAGEEAGGTMNITVNGTVSGETYTEGAVSITQISNAVSALPTVSFASTDLSGADVTSAVFAEHEGTLLVYFDPSDVEGSVKALQAAQALTDTVKVYGVAASDDQAAIDAVLAAAEGITFDVIYMSEGLEKAYKDMLLGKFPGALLVNSNAQIICATTTTEHWSAAAERTFGE